MFNSQHIREERRRRDADVAHPDDADSPDRAAILDEGSKVLGHWYAPLLVFKIDILPSVILFLRCQLVPKETLAERGADLEKLFMPAIQNEIE